MALGAMGKDKGEATERLDPKEPAPLAYPSHASMCMDELYR